MSIYHLSIKITSRGKGKSAVAAAAYRAAEKIRNKYDAMIHDYIRKTGVVHTEILLAENAPAEYQDRAVLWNAVEKAEKAKNAQLAREVELALPVELTIEQNISIVREYVKQQFVEEGMCADVAIHDAGTGNPHAHVMLTMRPIEPDGSWGAKSKKEYILDDNGERIRLESGEYKTRKICTVDWNEQSKAEEWRKAWAESVNSHLEKQNHPSRIDHRSYARQGLDQVPTIHLGIAASQMERRGIATDRGNINREIGVTNQQMGQLRARIRKAKDWLYAQPLENTPTMVSVMSHIGDSKILQSQWQKIRNLKAQASVLIFLQHNDIDDMEQLVEKVKQVQESFHEVSIETKKVERRLDTLAQHITQHDNLKKHRMVYERYKQLPAKNQDAFYEKHADEIDHYETARDYLKAVMNGRTPIPINAWKAEQAKLTAEKYKLSEQYYSLKDETRSIELIRRGVENLLREEAQRAIPERARDVSR